MRVLFLTEYQGVTGSKIWRLATRLASPRWEMEELHAHFSRRTSRKQCFRAEKARPVGILCFFDNFQTKYPSSLLSLLETLERNKTTEYSSLRQDMLFFGDKLFF
jgi:hypothetical protein